MKQISVNTTLSRNSAAAANQPSSARARRVGSRVRPSFRGPHPYLLASTLPATVVSAHVAGPGGSGNGPYELTRANVPRIEPKAQQTPDVAGLPEEDSHRSGPKYYRVTRERLEQLKEFKQRHGHAFVPYKEPSGLGRWIAEQRYRYQRGLCDVSIYRELSSAGVPLSAFEARWERKFQALSRFHAQRGHAFIQNKDTGSVDVEDGLYAWVLQQRQLRKQGRLSESRRRRLDALGFVWDVQQYTWRENMGLLRAFHEEHGHVRVSKGWEPAPRLYLFTRKIQQSSKAAFTDVPYATLEDIEVLRAMGAVRSRRKSWEEREEALLKCLAADVELDEALRAWLRVQRYEYRQGRMAEWRRRRLVETGLDGFGC